MTTTSWGGKDASGNPIAFAAESNIGGTLTPHSAPEINGGVVTAANPMPVSGTLTVAALLDIGTVEIANSLTAAIPGGVSITNLPTIQQVGGTVSVAGSITPASVGVTTTMGGGTIISSGAFQVALAANSNRQGGLFQNRGANPQYVFLGTTGATEAGAFMVSPGGTLSLNLPNGRVLTDQVLVAGTAGDSFVISNQ